MADLLVVKGWPHNKTVRRQKLSTPAGRTHRNKFVYSIYRYLNEINEDQQSLKKKTSYRCSILTVESRPDQITDEECIRLRKLGVSKVEIGVQHLDDGVLKYCKRGHGSSSVRKATLLLKNHGFKVGYHIMIGLPGSNPDLDEEMIEKKLWLPEFLPDFLKLYPCVLLKKRELQPELYNIFDSGKWTPPEKDFYLKILKILIDNVPPSVRISRVQRFFREDEVLGGFYRGIREDSAGVCRCIRCREAGKSAPNKLLDELRDVKTRFTKQGLDVCFEMIDENDTLLGIARLRTGENGFVILRELHIYGYAAPIGQKGQIQGRGLGKRMLRIVENYVIHNGYKKLLVNAAPGAKPFFRKAGYSDTPDVFLEKIFGVVEHRKETNSKDISL